MSRFYASIKGVAKTLGTRRGTAKSNIESHTRGWNKGIRVIGFVDSEGEDRFMIFETGGSNKPYDVKQLAEV